MKGGGGEAYLTVRYEGDRATGLTDGRTDSRKLSRLKSVRGGKKLQN